MPMMRRLVILLVALSVAGCVVEARPPVAVPGPPVLVWVPEWSVHVVQGYGVVHYNNAYFHYADGRWWISNAYTGPWAIVAAPPPVIAHIPPGQLHGRFPAHGPAGCPPGLAKQGRC